MTRTKLKIQTLPEYSELKILINHPMENGRNRDLDGRLIPAHFIETLTVERNGIPVLILQMGGSVAKQPFLSLRLAPLAAGERVRVSWQDNQGQTDQVEQLMAAP